MTTEVNWKAEWEAASSENIRLNDALNKIADLGCCGKSGGLQAAIDIAVSAITTKTKRWDGVIPLIEQILAEEGASVTFVCSNPDFNGLPNEAVTVLQGEDWQEVTYRADTLADCLRAALQ